MAMETTGYRFQAGSPRYAALSVRLDQAKLDAITKEIAHIPGALRRIFPTSLNQAAAETKTLLYKEFLVRMNIARKASIKDRLTLTPKASRHSFVSGVRVALLRFMVTSFKGTRWLKRQGVRWSPGPGGSRIIPHAFIAKGYTHAKTGQYMDQRMAWRRAGTGDNLVPRTPILALRGPSLAMVFSKSPGFQAQIERQGSKIVEKKLTSQVQRIIARFPR
jgi:hypothetical protein